MSAIRRTHRSTALLAALLLCAPLFLAPADARAAAYPAGGGPDHVLSYTTGALTWDEQTEVRPDGTARIDLFSGTYQNVASQNGERVIAPGTEALNTTRLENRSDHPIRYIAVMYRISDEPALPVEPELLGSSLEDASDYPLPDGVQDDQVVRAVTGTVAAESAQDLAIAWAWDYHENDERDATDTGLGNKAAHLDADEVTAGLYVVVEDDSSGTPESYIYPTLPQTGEGVAAAIGALLATAGLSFLLAAAARRWRDRACKER